MHGPAIMDMFHDHVDRTFFCTLDFVAFVHGGSTPGP